MHSPVDRRRPTVALRGRAHRSRSGPARRPADRQAGTATVSFQETKSGGAYAWHAAPARQLVITLSGTLDFQTREGRHFRLHPGDILFAEDTTGSGHSWTLVDDQPWRRAYVILAPTASVPFHPRPAGA